jgi:hypothetical protein
MSPSAINSCAALLRACSHYPQRFDNEGEVEEAEEEYVEFSNREKILRKPLSRRKSLSISLRFL